MSPELDEKLCKKYPEIFKQRNMSAQETCMCWGFSCGNGWYNIIDTLCFALMHDVEQARYNLETHEKTIKDPNFEKLCKEDNWYKTQYSKEMYEKKKEQLEKALKELPIATQVKEKFGTLRFYVQSGTNEHDAQITLAELMSGCTCEDCGLSDTTVMTYCIGWNRTLCPEHADKQYGHSTADGYRMLQKMRNK